MELLQKAINNVNFHMQRRTGRAGPRAGPGWPFKAHGPNGPKTGRKAFQDENKLHMKTKISVKIIQKYTFS